MTIRSTTPRSTPSYHAPGSTFSAKQQEFNKAVLQQIRELNQMIVQQSFLIYDLEEDHKHLVKRMQELEELL